MSRRRITTSIVKQIRELCEAGFTQAKICRKLDLHPETVRRHMSDEGEATIKAYQRARYDRERQDPVVVERRRAAAREYAQRQRDLAKADPNRPETKRELNRRLKLEREQRANVVEAPKLPGNERTCRICGVKFRTIYRAETCSPEHGHEWALEYKRRRRLKIKAAAGLGDVGLLGLGSAGGGRRKGEAHGQ